MNVTISIFMPVYNGSIYLKKSLSSLLNQTFKDFEIVCVDDSSTDNSYEILADYASRDKRVKVFTKPNGGDVPHSWIFALPHLSGEYIFYMSQDDFMSPDLLELTYKKAKESNADAVIPDLAVYRGPGKEHPSHVGLFGNRNAILSGKEAFLHSLKWDIHAFVLWKAELVKRIGFDVLAANSDEYATRKFFLNSRKVVFSEGIFYYGKENPDAITRKISLKRFDWCITNRRLLKLMEENDFSEKEVADFNYLFWSHIVYMHMLLIKYRKQLSRPDRVKAGHIIKESYSAVDYHKIKKQKGAKGHLIKLLFSHGCHPFIRIIVSLYSLFNHRVISG